MAMDESHFTSAADRDDGQRLLLRYVRDEDGSVAFFVYFAVVVILVSSGIDDHRDSTCFPSLDGREVDEEQEGEDLTLV